VALCTLLGQVRECVPVYGSGGFTTYDAPTLRQQVEYWTGELGISRVKIKIGESRGSEVSRDLDRVRQVCTLVPPETEVFVDANGGSSRKQAIRVGRYLDELGVTWFEEPVSSDDLAGLRLVRDALDCDVTAGEYGSDLPYFERMLGAGAVDCLQADVTRTAGITEWQRIAALAQAAGVELSAHCAPTLHLHVASVVTGLRHVEWFADHVRLEALMFDPGPRIRDGVMRPDTGRPGLGVELRTSELATRGAQLVLVGRREQTLNQTATMVGVRGGGANVLTADLTAPGEPERVVGSAVGLLGGLDVLINNAGSVGGRGLLLHGQQHSEPERSG